MFKFYGVIIPLFEDFVKSRNRLPLRPDLCEKSGYKPAFQPCTKIGLMV